MSLDFGFSVESDAPQRMIRNVQNIQRITHHGELAAIVLAGQAIIDDLLSDENFRHVQAMCLYALELAEEGRPGSYTDADADAYARAALAAP